jgi:ribosomal protein L30E
MDMGKTVKEAHDSGKLLIGSRSVMKGLKSGKVEKVIFASNCPESFRKSAVSPKSKAEVHEFGADSVRLGETCGKPFTVLVVGIKK